MRLFILGLLLAALPALAADKYWIDRSGTEDELLHFCLSKNRRYERVLQSGRQSDLFYVICGSSNEAPLEDINVIQFINHTVQVLHDLTETQGRCPSVPQSTLKDITELSFQELPPSDHDLYNTERTVLDYLNIFKTFSEHSLSNYLKDFSENKLIWIDSGAGSGDAQRLFHASFPVAPESHLVAFARFIPLDPQKIINFSHKFRRDGKIEYRYFPNETEREFIQLYRDKVDLITDIHGALAYSTHFSEVLKHYGNYLRPGGRLYLQTDEARFTFITGSGENLNLVDFLTRYVKGFSMKKGRDGVVFILERTTDELVVPEVDFLFMNTKSPPFHKAFRMRQPGVEKYLFDPRGPGGVSSIEQLRGAADPNYRLGSELAVLSEQVEKFKKELQAVEAQSGGHYSEAFSLLDAIETLEESFSQKTRALEIFRELKASDQYKDMDEQTIMRTLNSQRN